MGCVENETRGSLKPSGLKTISPLTVATLNYCGIMNSPFEFYCYDFYTELTEISAQFNAIIPKYFPQFNKTNFKWEMGNIDQKFRNRYSPMFDLYAGIENNMFINVQTFSKKWDQVFRTEVPKLKFEYKQQQKQTTKQYDIAMYHALLKYVYRISEIDDALKLSPEAYIKKFKPMFNLSFLDEEKKGQKVQKNLERINADIFFFQEYSKGFYEALKKSDDYHMSHDSSKDTMIIAKKSSFKCEKPAHHEIALQKFVDAQLRNQLNWADRSAYLIVDKYFCICAHLSSKKQKNEAQIQLMKETLQKVRQKLKGHFEIILGGDLNSFLQPFSEKFYMYPTQKDEMTTMKKRTSTQGQYNKAEKIVCESKDKILSTLKIMEGKISYITGKQASSNNFVPTDEHPFDHFVLVAVFERQES